MRITDSHEDQPRSVQPEAAGTRALTTAEGWSRDVSEDVAHELRRRCADQDRELPGSVEPFVERYEGAYSGVQLPLGLP